MQATGFIIFLSILTIIFVLLDFYTISKLNKIVKLRNWNQLITKIAWYSSILSLLVWLVVATGRVFEPFDRNIMINLFKVVSIWYLPKILIFLIIFPVDIFNLLKNLILKIFKNNAKVENQTKVSSRRKFVQNTALGFAGIPFVLGLNGALVSVTNLRVYRENIYLKDLPINLNELRIVQISDLHFGSFPDKSTIIEMCYQISSLNPDIIFITGDFVNFDPNELDLGLEEVSQIRSRYGTFAVLGNHDHYMKNSDHQSLISRIKESGINLLINENVELNINEEIINIVGVDNSGSRQNFADWNKAFEGINKRNKTILLCHDPIHWERHIIDNYPADLTLSGHTHGGQIAFSLLGLEFSPAQLAYKHYAGLYTHNDQYLYVNRGIGTSGPPMRLSMDPEITLITFKTENNLAKD